MTSESCNWLKTLLDNYVSNVGNKANRPELEQALNAVTKSERYELVSRERDDLGYTALHIAAINGHPKTMKLLLAPFNAIEVSKLLKLQTGLGYTAIMQAAKRSHRKTLGQMLERVSTDCLYPLLGMQEWHGSNAIHCAANDDDTVKCILSAILTPGEIFNLLMKTDNEGVKAVDRINHKGLTRYIHDMLSGNDQMMEMLGFRREQMNLQMSSEEEVSQLRRRCEALRDAAARLRMMLEEKDTTIQHQQQQISALNHSVDELGVKLQQRDQKTLELEEQHERDVRERETDAREIQRLRVLLEEQHERNVRERETDAREIQRLRALLEEQHERNVRERETDAREIQRLTALLPSKNEPPGNKVDQLEKGVADNKQLIVDLGGKFSQLQDQVLLTDEKFQGKANKEWTPEQPTESYVECVMVESRPATPPGQEPIDESEDEGMQERGD